MTDGDGNILKYGCWVQTFATYDEAAQGCVDNGMDRLFAITSQDDYDSFVTFATTSAGTIWTINGIYSGDDGAWYVYNPDQNSLFPGAVPTSGNDGDVLKILGNQGNFATGPYPSDDATHYLCEYPAPSSSSCTLEDSTENTLCDLLESVQALETADQSLSSSITNIENNYQTLESQFNSLTQEVNDLTNNVNTLNDQAVEYEGKIEALENDVEGLKTDTADLEAKNDEQDSRLDELEAQAQNLTDCVDSLKNETAELSAENQEQDNKLDELQGQIDYLMEENDKLKQKNDEQDQKITDLEEENENLKCLLAALQGKVAKIEEFFYPGGKIFIRSGGQRIVKY